MHRKIFRFFATAIIVLTLGINSATPVLIWADTSTNLVKNPGLENSAVNSGLPDNWTGDSWGVNNSTSQYSSSGHSGSRSVSVSVAGYIDGDAKWIFDPVQISANTKYDYSDWYKSDTITNLWAQFKDPTGANSYQWLGSVAPSTSWTQSTKTFTVPSGKTKVSVFHVLNGNGSLSIDDVSLSENIPPPNCAADLSSGVPNGGFEQSCASAPNQPVGWSAVSYSGANSSSGYLNNGYSGSHSISTTLSSSSGEAGWQSDWQTISSNQRYNLSFWHNDTTYIYAYLAFRMSDGSIVYSGLMSVPATQNTGWSKYSDEFIAPIGSTNMQLTIATSGQGTFNVDDVSLSQLVNQTPQIFSSGLVSLTFDDNSASVYKNGLPTLNSMGYKATFYVNASTLGSAGYMTKTNLKTLASSGHEIASHLYEHVDMVTLTQDQLQQEITNNNNTILSILGSNYNLNSFASPFGSYTSTSVDTVMASYTSHRVTDGRFNSKANLDPRQIHAKIVSSTTTAQDVQSWIDQAKQQNLWLVLVYHTVGASGANTGDVIVVCDFLL